MDLDEEELIATKKLNGSYGRKEEKFIIFTKDKEAVHVNILRNGIQVADVLLGLAATIKIIMQETGKSEIDIYKVISSFIDSSEKKGGI